MNRIAKTAMALSLALMLSAASTTASKAQWNGWVIGLGFGAPYFFGPGDATEPAFDYPPPPVPVAPGYHPGMPSYAFDPAYAYTGDPAYAYGYGYGYGGNAMGPWQERRLRGLDY